MLHWMAEGVVIVLVWSTTVLALAALSKKP